MIYRRFLVFNIFLFFSILTISAQTIFREGYIVKNNGDTLHGLVLYQGKKKQPGKCTFKRFDIAKTIKYNAPDIKSFGYKSGNSYVVKKIGQKQEFIECLVKGKINVYLDKNEFFIEKSEYILTPLSKGIITTEKNGNKMKFKDFKQFLADLTNDKPGFEIPIELNLQEQEIVDLISKYNQSQNEKYFVYNRQPFFDIFDDASLITSANMTSFGVKAGYASAKYHLKRGDVDKYIPDFHAH